MGLIQQDRAEESGGPCVFSSTVWPLWRGWPWMAVDGMDGMDGMKHGWMSPARSHASWPRLCAQCRWRVVDESDTGEQDTGE